MRPPDLARQRGTVLVTVLMMFAIAAFLAAEMAYRQKLDVRRTSAMLMSEQAREYLLGAEALAKLALKDDFKAEKRQNEFIDSLDEEWALRRPPFPVEGGYIQGELIDAQSKFNINDLVDDNGTTQGDSAKVGRYFFIELLKQLDIPKEGSPEAVYEKVVDWLDADQNETGTDGSEDGAYLRGKRPFRAANRWIVDISELRSIDGMDQETFNKLAEHLVALPPGTRKNINTLDSKLIAIMGIQSQTDLIAKQKNGGVNKNALSAYYPDEAQLKAKARISGGSSGDDSGGAGGTGGSGGSANTFKVENLFSTQSDYFELRAKAEVGGRVVYSKSLIYRYPDDGQAPEKSGKLKVIYRAYVDPLQQPMTLPPATANN